MKLNRAIFLLTISFHTVTSSAQLEISSVIEEPELRAHVEFLASPELQGRNAPGIGSETAQRYITTRFKQYGLEQFESAPGYYQEVPLLVQKTDYDSTKLFLKVEDTSFAFSALEDFLFLPKSGHDVDITGKLALAGYCIHAPEYNYDDFNDMDLQGKILLAFTGEPQNEEGKSVFTDARSTKYSRATVKARAAQERGALALLLMLPPESDLPANEKTLGRSMSRAHEPIVQLRERSSNNLPVFYLKTEKFTDILKRQLDLHSYQESLDESLKGNPYTFEDTEITLSVRFKEIQEESTANIIAYLPGKIDEAVLLIAHHDHEGIKDGELYPGADDNASGVAGLLEIAHSFSNVNERLRRSIIFLSTGAEEKGLLGSNYFVNHPVYPLENVTVVINMDEIGRDGSSQFRAMMDPSIPGEKNLLMFFYSGQTPDLAEIAVEENATIGLKLVAEPVLQFHSGSDHVPFHNKQIPSVFLFTGFHSDYTSPGDTPDKIVYEKLTRVARLAFSMTYQIANREERLTFDTSIKEVIRQGKYGH